MLKLSDLCKGYVDGGEFHPVLQGAELTLQQGEQVALMGESGSGKSTLLNLIAGLDTADSGEIQYPSFAMHSAPEHLRTLYRRNNIGNIFQQFNLLPTLNIADNIRFCRQLKGLPEDKGLWRQILSALDLMPLLGRYPEEVSGGQQQRAAIARALYMEPKILLADEPTGSLDERNAEAVMRLLTSLARQLECTLLLVTHSEKVAEHMEGRIRLQGGQLHVMPVVKALLGHYRRYPLQIILVWLGLTLGVSLLVGVTSINQHAKQSYETGEKLFSNPLPYRIRTKHSANKIPQGFYIQLRRAGFNQCAPFDILHLDTKADLSLMLVGVDPVALLPLHQGKSLKDLPMLSLMKPPYPILASQDLAAHMQWNDGDFIELNDGSRLGPLKVDTDNLLSGTRLVTDISLLRMLKRSSGLSAIACGEMSEEKMLALKNMLPNGMTLVRNSRSELESLTKAFHMNLTAMGMLSFLVGLFIFYQAMSLSFIQRQRLVGILRQTGVNGMQLAQALMLELTILVLVAWACGNFFGLILANELIPAVSSSLSDLYDANVGLTIGWSWESSLYSLAMSAMGALISCLWPLIRLLKSQPIRLSSRLSLMRFAGREFSWQAFAACAFCVAAVAVYQAPKTQESGFAIIALMLISVALFMPFLMWHMFQSFSYSLRWVRVRWFFADAAASMSYRGVATMAFMLALAANIGVETMVGSFRDTTDKWLSQRLAADIYIYPTNNSAARMSAWLKEQPEVDAVWWRWEKDVPTERGALQVVSTGSSEGELDSLTVKLGVPNYWYHLHHSKSLMVSESMALKLDIRPGDYIDLQPPLGGGWQVVGVYYDYGNPYNQIMMSHRNWLYAFAGSGNVGLGVLLEDNVNGEGLKRRLENVFRLSQDRVFDNNNIYNQAMRVFDHTFAIAGTLGNITLIIAVFGLFFATLAGELSRQRHFSLLRCMGVSGKELVMLGGLQLFVFGTISAIIAVPLGLALAHLIVDIIIKQSFGWSLELQTIPWEYAQTIAWAMLAIMIAGALPVIRMIKSTPMKSLRDAL